jgi:4-hydroxybenzoate polyprenyltransferase
VIIRLLTLIKFSHTLFALPFAIATMLLAAGGWPSGTVSLWILSCMVFARTAAMAFNRWADWHFDQANPRTAGRSQLATRSQVWALFIISLLLFLGSALQIHMLCFLLSPLAIMLFCGYSLMKRFSAMSHFVLGLALSAAPMGAWIAVAGDAWNPLPWGISMAVVFWVAGFDVIYATQDIEVDRQLKLHSIPVIFGYTRSLKIAATAHGVAWIAFIMVGLLGDFHPAYYGACLLIGLFLFMQHRIAAQRTPQAIQQAFFGLNVVISLLFLAAVVFELWIQSSLVTV